MEGVQLNLRRKRGIATGVLIALAIWPCAHRLLVARLDLNPWRFFGWAMYCQPNLRPIVRIAAEPGGESAIVPNGTTAEALDRFLRERHVWGRLRQPDRLAEIVLLEHPDFSAVEIVVERRRLEAGTGRLGTVRDVYRYRRTAAEPP